MARSLPPDRGAINFVKLLLYSGIVVGAYLGWIYVPLVIDYFGMRFAVNKACNVAYGDRSADSVRNTVMKEWQELKIQDGVLEDGVIRKVPTPFDREKNIEVEITKSPPAITVSVDYTVHVVFPYLNKERDVAFAYTHTEDLSPIKY